MRNTRGKRGGKNLWDARLTNKVEAASTRTVVACGEVARSWTRTITTEKQKDEEVKGDDDMCKFMQKRKQKTQGQEKVEADKEDVDNNRKC